MKDDKLFTEFPPISTKEWEEAIAKDLKGADYEKKLVWKTLEGFNVKPYYRAEDLKDLNLAPSQKKDNNWDIRQDIFEKDLRAANAIAQVGLERGITSLGLNAQNVISIEDLETLLAGIDITKTKINFIAASCYYHLATFFVEYIKKHNIDSDKVYGSMNFDPFVKGALYKGELCHAEQDLAQRAIRLLNTLKDAVPHFKCITVNGHVFNNAGAAIVQELAYTLSAANDYMARLTDAGAKIDDVAKRLQIAYAIGGNYFMEIAKLRATRLLFSKIVAAYAPACSCCQQVFIATESSYYNKTIFDPYVNMLRTTTETMSSAIAGADSISVHPFDVAFSKADEFSMRIANNQQILLKEESYMNKIVDPAAGSYYIENLTHLLCEGAWALFKSIEDKGGFLKAIQEGTIQDDIEKIASQRAKEAAMRKTVIVGTNQFPNLGETMSEKITSVCPGKIENRATKIKTLRWNRLAEPFENLRLEVEKAGKKPKVFLLTFGNIAMRKARAGFATNFYGVAGYQIIDNAGFSTPEEGAKQALVSGAEVVVLCSSDEEYDALVAGAMPLLKGKIKFAVLAGNPADKAEQYKAEGINDFIHVKTNCLETLIAYNKALLK